MDAIASLFLELCLGKGLLLMGVLYRNHDRVKSGRTQMYAGILDSFNPSFDQSNLLRRIITMRRLMSALLTCSLLSCLATAALAQTSGSLSGTIKDPSGASLAGVAVTVKNLGTGEHLNTTTNDRGAFVFPSLMPGEYSLTAEISGFKKAELPQVVVAVSTPAKVNLSLEVGEVTNP